MAKSTNGLKSRSSVRSGAKKSAIARQSLGEASAQLKAKKPTNFEMPLDIIEKSRKWGYKTYTSVRQRINKELAKHPDFLSSPHATKQNLAEMNRGRNPYAPESQTKGKNKKMQYDHHIEQKQINKTYKNQPKKRAKALTNVANLTMRTPVSHNRKLSYRFHKAAETPVIGHSRFSAPSPIKTPKGPTVKKTQPTVPHVQKSPLSKFKKL